MKNPVLHFTTRLLPATISACVCGMRADKGVGMRFAHCRRLASPVLWLLFVFSSMGHASPQPSNEVHFHGVVDYEAMRARDSLYAATKRSLNLNVR